MQISKNVQQGSFISYQLSHHKLSMTLIAESYGCTPDMINKVVWGKRRSKDIEAFIANILGYKSWTDLKKAEKKFNESAKSHLRGIA